MIPQIRGLKFTMKKEGPGRGWWGPPKGTHGRQNKLSASSDVSMDDDIDKKAANFIDADVSRDELGFAEENSISQLKHQVVSRLADETGRSYKDANSFVKNWAITSNKSEFSIAIQMEAAVQLDAKLSDWQRGLITQKGLDKAPFMKHMRNDARPFVEQTYRLTQKELARVGIQDVVLYRGVRSKGGSFTKGGTINIQMNALESWTASPEIARGFGGLVLKARFPRSRIYSTPKTGPGCFDEYEFIMLGGKDDQAIVFET